MNCKLVLRLLILYCSVLTTVVTQSCHYSYCTGRLVFYWSCTAFSLSYKRWNLTCGECSMCIVRDTTEVTWSFLTVEPSSVTAQPSNALCGAKRGEGRESKKRQRSATVAQSRSLRFLNFSSSRMGRLRHSIILWSVSMFLKSTPIQIILPTFCRYFATPPYLHTCFLHFILLDLLILICSFFRGLS
jgi:hypothetical protein